MDHPNPHHNGVAAVIDNHPKRKNYSQNELADAAGIARSTFVRRMRRNDWGIDELDRVAQALGTTTSALVAAAEKSAA